MKWLWPYGCQINQIQSRDVCFIQEAQDVSSIFNSKLKLLWVSLNISEDNQDFPFHIIYLLQRRYIIRMECGRPGFDPWVGKFPWRRARQPTPVFWRILMDRGDCRLQSMESQRAGHDWATKHSIQHIIYPCSSFYFNLSSSYSVFNCSS